MWKELSLEEKQGFDGAQAKEISNVLTAGALRSLTRQEEEQLDKETVMQMRWVLTVKGNGTPKDRLVVLGTNIIQEPDMSIRVSQEDYITKWLSEAEISKECAKEVKSPLTPQELSALRGLIGTMSWKATQTGPQYLADVSLLLSEIPYATVETFLRGNKLAREMRRDAKQSIRFPSWRLKWQQLAVITWADASQHNMPDKSSTLGYVSVIAPRAALEGEEVAVAMVCWRSAKTPRQCLCSNGAEVQAITEGEHATFKIWALLLEFHGVSFDRGNLFDQVKSHTEGALVMDSRGVFDAATRNVSSLHGMRSSRAGYELTLSVCQARKINTKFRWVNRLAQLADCLTKTNVRKSMLQFMADGQRWRPVDDPKFTAGKKLKKRELLERVKNLKAQFVSSIREMALSQRWPWEEPEVRNSTDELLDPDHGMLHM